MTMLKNSLVVCGIALSCLLATVPAAAQESATLVLKSGDRISGELLDLGGVGFTMRVNGQERNVAVGDVAVVEFTGGNPSADVRTRLQNGRSVVVLRSGEVIDGRLFDIGGSRPLRVSLDTPSGQRDFTSNDVAQIYYSDPTRSSASAAVEEAVSPTAIRVNANQAWTDTGITVRRGQSVVFKGSGHIMAGEGLSSGVGGTPAMDANRMPIRGVAGAALIGRIGNGAPFLIGANQNPIEMPANGRLMLGINDDHVPDNTGNYMVEVIPSAAAQIRRR